MTDRRWIDPHAWLGLGGGVRLVVCECGGVHWIPWPDKLGENCADCGKASPLSIKAER